MKELTPQSIMTSQTVDPDVAQSERHGLANRREEELLAEALCPLLRRAGRVNIKMKIDRVRYNRPKLPFGNTTSPSPTPRDFTFTPTQRLYIQDYIARGEVKSPGCNQIRDNMLFSHLNIAVTDKERAKMCRKGPTYAIQQKVLGGDRYVVPQTRPLGSLIVQQISPCPPAEKKRATSATLPSECQKANQKSPKCDIRYRKTGLFNRFQLDATQMSLPCENRDIVTKTTERLVHFSEDSPKGRSGEERFLEDKKDSGSSGCPTNRAEMVLPKVDLTSAIEDGVRATVHAILTNRAASPRQLLSQREQTILTLLSKREFGEAKPETIKPPRRLQTKRCLTPHPAQDVSDDNVDSRRPRSPAKDTARTGSPVPVWTGSPVPVWTAPSMDTEAVPDYHLIRCDMDSADRRVPRCPSARRCPSPRQSVKMQTFQMAMPS